MNTPNPSQWGTLFDQAMSIIDQANENSLAGVRFSFGGGTALMLQLDHRESHDVDLFIDDPQILPFLNPQTQDYQMDITPSDYETDGARALKITFDGIGEIDFICAGHITQTPTSPTEIRGRIVELELPEEIIFKKVHYRGQRMQPRDMFDIAAAVNALGQDKIATALAEAVGNCEAALATAQRMDAEFAMRGMEQLMLRPGMEKLPEIAQEITIRTLKAAVAKI